MTYTQLVSKSPADYMIRLLNTDDLIRETIYECDGIDLRNVTEILNDDELSHHTADSMLSPPGISESRRIRVLLHDGTRATFFWACSGSPDGIWSHMSTDRNHPAFYGAL